MYLLSTQESIVHLSSVPPNQIAHSLQQFKLSTFPMIQRLHTPSTIEPNKSTQLVHVHNILIALFPTTTIVYPQGHSPCTVMPQSPLQGHDNLFTPSSSPRAQSGNGTNIRIVIENLPITKFLDQTFSIMLANRRYNIHLFS